VSIPTKEEAPNKLHQKYILKRTDGKPIDEKAEFFILRLDELGHNPVHLNACRRGVLAYADAIAATKPELAKDLYNRYNSTVGKDKIQLNPDPHF
jgi:hypothetical protein